MHSTPRLIEDRPIKNAHPNRQPQAANESKTMKTIHRILTTLALALAFSVQCLSAAEKPSATAPGAQNNQTAPGDASTATFLDKKIQVRLKRAHHLAEKSANREFLNSPQGISFKKQISSVDDEINAVYEKYLNICREDPATEKGKKLRAERDRQIQLLKQKKEKAEADYEKLKKTSPVYRDMLAAHLKSELKQVKGKLKSQSPEEKEDSDK